MSATSDINFEDVVPTAAQRPFIKRHSPCMLGRGVSSGYTFVYCYSDIRVTRYQLSPDGHVVDSRSFRASEADLRVAAALSDPVTQELEDLFRAEGYRGPANPAKRHRRR